MAGIYLHIPFCKQACTYCDFHFSTSRKLKPQVLKALDGELELRRHLHGISDLNTVYFGGGTPSILDPGDLRGLLQGVRERYDVAPDAEITLEANPDDMTPEAVGAWKAAEVNRLSIGIQSFQDRYLKWMNRAHDARMALSAVQTALEGGIDNLSIDLIYGLPGMGTADWEAELDRATGLGAGHISAYCLTVEPRTALGHRVRSGQEKPVDEDAAAAQFEVMTHRLSAAGYMQYEVSNFAKPGFESRHNSGYWRGEPYLGIGPAAHGFVDGDRYWNVANNARYIAAIAGGDLPQTVERLSPHERYNEWVMTGLRTREGIRPTEAKSRFDVDFDGRFSGYVDRLEEEGLAETNGGVLRLTVKGLFLADGIAAEFFL